MGWLHLGANICHCGTASEWRTLHILCAMLSLSACISPRLTFLLRPNCAHVVFKINYYFNFGTISHRSCATVNIVVVILVCCNSNLLCLNGATFTYVYSYFYTLLLDNRCCTYCVHGAQKERQFPAVADMNFLNLLSLFFLFFVAPWSKDTGGQKHWYYYFWPTSTKPQAWN